MSNAATLICSPRLTYTPTDIGAGIPPESGVVDVMWFALFDESDMRYMEVPVQGGVRHVPYLCTSAEQAYQRVVEHKPTWRVLCGERPILRTLLEDTRVRASGYLILDTWALWENWGIVAQISVVGAFVA